jgi:hypothetical protein
MMIICHAERIYDDNLSFKILSEAKKKKNILSLSFLFERKTVATCFVRHLRRVFLMEFTPNDLLCVPWSSWEPKNHYHFIHSRRNKYIHIRLITFTHISIKTILMIQKFTFKSKTQIYGICGISS